MVEAYGSSIICNTFDKLDMGAHFNGNSCDASTVAENTFGDHNIGLSLDDNTTIGQQVYNRNEWPASASASEADFAVLFGDPFYFSKMSNSKMIIQVGETPGSTYWAQPRNPALYDWFDYTAPTRPIAYKCPAIYVEPGDGDGGHTDGRMLSATDENVIAGTQQAYGFEATLWDAQVRLYRNLYENQDLRPAGSDAAAFYTSNSESSYAHLAVALSKYDQSMGVDELTRAQLGDLYTQAQSAQEEQSGDLEALNQTIGTLLNELEVARNEQLKNLQTELAAVEAVTDYETNLKNALSILVTTALSAEPWKWTSEQEAELQLIADQCKLPGGFGVSLARLMLGQTDALDEDCTSENRNTKVVGVEDWKLSPNPTAGNLQIILPANMEATALNLYNTQGQKLGTYKIDKESTLLWNIGDLANGIYYLKICGTKKSYSVQKILLQH